MASVWSAMLNQEQPGGQWCQGALGGESAFSRKGDLCLSRVLPPSVDKSNIWSKVPFQVANAEFLSPLKVGTMWSPPSEPILKISVCL